MRDVFVVKSPLTVQVHLGNPKMARIPELDIRQMPECEGGGWYMNADAANAIVDCWNGFLERGKEGQHPTWNEICQYWKIRSERLESALKGYACSCANGFCEEADDEGTAQHDSAACGFNARKAIKENETHS